MRKMLASLSQMLFPHVCICCNDYLSNQEDTVCDFCIYSLPKFEFHKDEKNQLNQIFWGRTQLIFTSAYLRFMENSDVKIIIHHLKYKGNQHLGIIMGELMGHFLKETVDLSLVDYLVPIPLHKRRQAKRGFNQSGLIAQGVSKVTGIAVLNDVVIRVKNTTTQTLKSRYDRYENMEGIFRLQPSCVMEDKHVLIVDDVITTGATIVACAETIQQLKNVKVSVCCLAIAD